jgi:hypothetical protein
MKLKLSFSHYADWNPNFKTLYLLNYWEPGDDDIDKVVELCVDNNFVNWLKDWFGLVGELQVAKVRYSETEKSNFQT